METITIAEITKATEGNKPGEVRLTDGRKLKFWPDKLENIVAIGTGTGKIGQGKPWTSSKGVTMPGDLILNEWTPQVASMVAQAPTTPQQAPQTARMPISDDRNRSIEAQTAIKAACDLYQGSGDPGAALSAAKGFFNWIQLAKQEPQDPFGE